MSEATGRQARKSGGPSMATTRRNAPSGRGEAQMSIRLKFTLLTIAATFAAPAAYATYDTPPTGSAPKPPLCTGGRFAVGGSPLLGPGGEVIVLENGTLSIGSLCPARHATLARRKKGTAVTVVFRGCSGVSGRVRVTALIGNNCSTVTG